MHGRPQKTNFPIFDQTLRNTEFVTVDKYERVVGNGNYQDHLCTSDCLTFFYILFPILLTILGGIETFITLLWNEK